MPDQDTFTITLSRTQWAALADMARRGIDDVAAWLRDGDPRADGYTEDEEDAVKQVALTAITTLSSLDAATAWTDARPDQAPPCYVPCLSCVYWCRARRVGAAAAASGRRPGLFTPSQDYRTPPHYVPSVTKG